MQRLLVLFAGVSTLFFVTVNAQVVFRFMDPVALNDSVLISGAGLGSGAANFCDRTGACALSSSLVPSDASNKFVVPAALASASTYHVTLASGPSFMLNVPTLDWWHSDDAASGSAAPNRVLRIFGRSLAWSVEGASCPSLTPGGIRTPGAGAHVIIVASGMSPTSASAIEVVADVASCWRLDILLPAALSLSTNYDLWVGNGLKGPGLLPIGSGDDEGVLLFTFTTVAVPTWPSAVFTFGITPGCNSGKSLASCITFAGASGGGTVLLPTGVTYATGSDAIIFPANASVTLAGAGMNVSELTWTVGTGFPNPIAAVITGSDASARWALRDLTISVYAADRPGAQPSTGLPVILAGPGSVGIRIDRVRVIENLTLVPQIEAGNAIRGIGTSRLTLTDCEVRLAGNCGAQWPANTPFNLDNSTDVTILRTSFMSACQSWAISGSRIFFADSSFQAVGVVSGGAQVGTDGGAPYIAEHIYYGNNSDLGNPAALMRWETMTYDGPGGWYNGTAASVDAVGTTLTLSSPMLGCPAGSNTGCVYPGATIALMRGPGQGQWRKVISITNANGSPHVLIDAPFDPQPVFGAANATNTTATYMSITVTHGQATFEGNLYQNGTVFQTYGAAMNTVVAGNVFSEMFSTEWMNTTNVVAGVRIFGHRYINGYQPNYWTLLTDNVLDCASDFRIYQDNIDDVIFQYGAVVRRNIINGGTNLGLNFANDDVIEHNTFGSAYCAYAGSTLPPGGILVNSSSSGILVR